MVTANRTFDSSLIDLIVGRIVDTIRPEKVILFGSRARGDADANSDYDLLVIQPSGEPRYRRSALLYRALSDIPVEVEVLVYTPAEVEEWPLTPSTSCGVKGWRGVPRAFVTTAIREGRVLNEKQN